MKEIIEIIGLENNVNLYTLAAVIIYVVAKYGPTWFEVIDKRQQQKAVLAKQRQQDVTKD
jgi:hypothetical protein